MLCKQIWLLGIPSPTHSFTPGLKPSFSANPSLRSSSFFFFRIHYMDSLDCLLLFLSISVFYVLVFLFLHFLVVGSVRQIKLTHAHVRFRVHIKIASRIVSYQWRWPVYGCAASVDHGQNTLNQQQQQQQAADELCYLTSNMQVVTIHQRTLVHTAERQPATGHCITTEHQEQCHT